MQGVICDSVVFNFSLGKCRFPGRINKTNSQDQWYCVLTVVRMVLGTVIHTNYVLVFSTVFGKTVRISLFSFLQGQSVTPMSDDDIF